MKFCQRHKGWVPRDGFEGHLCQTPDDGHQFHLTVASQMSAAVGDGPHEDADWVGPAWTLTVRAWSLRAALELAAEQPLTAWDRGSEHEDGFTCPRCGRTSHHPEDKRHGYCGACHAFTAPPAGVPR